MKVADKHGNVIRGLYRIPNGGLIVDDTEGYHKYNKELKAAKELSEVKQELEELRDMVKLLLKNKQGN